MSLALLFVKLNSRRYYVMKRKGHTNKNNVSIPLTSHKQKKTKTKKTLLKNSAFRWQ